MRARARWARHQTPDCIRALSSHGGRGPWGGYGLAPSSWVSLQQVSLSLLPALQRTTHSNSNHAPQPCRTIPTRPPYAIPTPLHCPHTCAACGVPGPPPRPAAAAPPPWRRAAPGSRGPPRTRAKRMGVAVRLTVRESLPQHGPRHLPAAVRIYYCSYLVLQHGPRHLPAPVRLYYCSYLVLQHSPRHLLGHQRALQLTRGALGDLAERG